jgi:transposase InsO family protein
MELHANARLSLKGRELLVERVDVGGWSLAQAAEAAGVSERTARKWLARWRDEGAEGLRDRSSAPKVVSNRTADCTVEAIVALRKVRMTAAEIAECFDMALSTVSGILTRLGLGKLGRLGLEPAIRYERQRPGELLHIDIKKLGRIEGGAGKRITGITRNRSPRRRDRSGVDRCVIGWEYVHVCVDDATRLAYVEVLSDEKATTAVGFLRRAIKHFAARGIQTESVITDNGSPYRSTAHAIACRALGIRHLKTRPYRPQTNGKAERFIRTLLQGWAYGAIYRSSKQRTAALHGWLDFYNHRRPHGALSHQPPLSRLRQLSGNNLLGSYS